MTEIRVIAVKVQGKPLITLIDYTDEQHSRVQLDAHGIRIPDVNPHSDLITIIPIHMVEEIIIRSPK